MAKTLSMKNHFWRGVLQRQVFLYRWFGPAAVNFHCSAVRPGYKLVGNLRDCYSILRVDYDADDDELKQAYKKLAKEYHPDSASVTADAKKFHQLQEAYRTIRAHRIDTEARMTGALSELDDEEEDDDGYKHKAPQHRQYLSNEGIGYGTPSQRQRQYQQYKVERASEAVTKKRISVIQTQYEDALLVQDKKATRKRTVRSGMERLVEDLIQESMSRGEFKDLPGEGKPLKSQTETSKAVDDLTYNLNKIVIDQGFAPEWVRLNGGISKDVEKARKMLTDARIRAGPEPVPPSKNKFWTEGVAQFKEKMVEINKDVDRLNLVVPSMYQQQVRYNAGREIERVSQWYKDQVKAGKVPQIPEPEEKPKREKVKSNNGVWQGIKDLFSNS